MAREVKSVSFNMTDVFEAKLLEHAENNGIFSRYIKRLIAKDFESGAVSLAPVVAEDNGQNADYSTFY